MGCGAGHVVVLTSRNEEEDITPNLDFTLPLPSAPLPSVSAENDSVMQEVVEPVQIKEPSVQIVSQGEV